MTAKHVTIIVVILVVAGLAAALTTQFNKDTNTDVKITPTPTPAQLNFKTVEQNQPPQMTQQKKAYTQFPGVYPPEDLKSKKIILSTEKGVIEFELYPEATKAASNFIFLTLEGFYNGLTFHRVEDWVVQGCDPKSDGTGGNSTLPTENSSETFTTGALGVARKAVPADVSNDSQFFIVKKDLWI